MVKICFKAKRDGMYHSRCMRGDKPMTKPRQKTKPEMVGAIAERTSLSKDEVVQVLDAIAEVALADHRNRHAA